ncbi:hypothetical protein RJT34_17745 [Clitoria ternatea]|uniref:Uncharacterized protein n=1 Tax=Clitoria ternatea TaxID=43366 RepID=A0AAN9J9W5_CLITE
MSTLYEWVGETRGAHGGIQVDLYRNTFLRNRCDKVLGEACEGKDGSFGVDIGGNYGHQFVNAKQFGEHVDHKTILGNGLGNITKDKDKQVGLGLRITLVHNDTNPHLMSNSKGPVLNGESTPTRDREIMMDIIL